jgi:hypothetical protein
MVDWAWRAFPRRDRRRLSIIGFVPSGEWDLAYCPGSFLASARENWVRFVLATLPRWCFYR